MKFWKRRTKKNVNIRDGLQKKRAKQRFFYSRMMKDETIRRERDENWCARKYAPLSNGNVRENHPLLAGPGIYMNAERVAGVGVRAAAAAAIPTHQPATCAWHVTRRRHASRESIKTDTFSPSCLPSTFHRPRPRVTSTTAAAAGAASTPSPINKSIISVMNLL